MSNNKRRTHAQRARAERVRQRTETNLVEHIARNEELAGKNKKLPPENKFEAPVQASPVSNPYLRMLARIDADNAERRK